MAFDAITWNSMPRPDRYADEDSLPVMMPRNDKALVAVPPERVRRLREHLIEEHESCEPRSISNASPRLNGRSQLGLQRPSRAPLVLCARGVLQERRRDAFPDDWRASPQTGCVRTRRAAVIYISSASRQCIFHGKGCTLDRSLCADEPGYFQPMLSARRHAVRKRGLRSPQRSC